ncbi:MAG: ATP-dependent acyl-CoA ligase, partial [Alphaproteobacteria bacterium]|nr:ATP-dependent acyl-CoA ligase [Alphaproteobacteria bacterium]
GATLDPAELRAFASRRMAGFMVPRYVEIVDKLPRSELGKVEPLKLKTMGPGVWDAEAKKI